MIKYSLKFIVSIMTAIIYLSTFSINVAASEINISGLNELPEEYQNNINGMLDSISDGVIDLYNITGGTVYFKQALLDDGTGENLNIMGLYFPESSDIHIRSDEYSISKSGTLISKITAHEIGHFVYHKAYLFLSPESKDVLLSCFNYWKNYSPECYNEDETFAVMYSWKKTGMGYLTRDVQLMIAEAENICGGLALHIEKNGNDIGPGTLFQYSSLE